MCVSVCVQFTFLINFDWIVKCFRLGFKLGGFSQNTAHRHR